MKKLSDITKEISGINWALQVVKSKEKDSLKEMSPINEAIFRNKWETITQNDIVDFVKKNKLKLVKDKSQGIELWLGVYPNTRKLAFKYDPEELEMFSDHTPLDFKRGKVK